MSESILLYRFLPVEAAIKTIEMRAFRVSRLVELNDPFEWLPGLDGVENLPPGGAGLANWCMDQALKDLNDRMGMLCFSKTFRDLVLWSHYADLHRGIAIEVNHPIVESLYQVKYDKPRPIIPLSWWHDDSKRKELEERLWDLFLQKSAGWSYEKEYRVVVGLDLCPIYEGMYFRPIPDKPENFITRVIIGARSTVSPSYVRRTLEMNDLKNVQVVKAQRSLKTYDIEVE